MAEISIVKLMNRALIKIGVERIASPDEQSEAARVCNEVYATLIRAELRKNPWTFAIGRSTLAALAAAPAWGFGVQYQLPDDFIRVVQVGEYFEFAAVREGMDQSPVPYTIEGRTLLTDMAAPLKFRWVRDMSEDPTSWDPLFFEAAACRMANEICDSLTKDKQKREQAKVAYNDAIREAKRVNAIEVPPQLLPDNSWVSGRY